MSNVDGLLFALSDNVLVSHIFDGYVYEKSLRDMKLRHKAEKDILIALVSRPSILTTESSTSIQ